MKDILEYFRINLNLLEGKLLDLGCGSGVPVCQHFLHYGWEVTGIDISANMLELARQSNPDGVFHQADMVEYEMAESRYDAITAIYSLFHLTLANQSSVFIKVQRALKPGGQFLFAYATQDYTGYAEFSGNLSFLGVMLPYHHTTPDKLLAELASIGLTAEFVAHINKGGETFLWVIVKKS
ncbi:class I SAM-dependent methyltransferase [Thiospirillum jenense]|uniref:Class I SAM-dependent methyltransferase n=2 Tax=Thiospirillum jenense TaxID=1653858 RepID=A0A839HDN0_9GAMM|nr:class I SAM-dependent methyltransferase [Thiospirillum jenense]